MVEGTSKSEIHLITIN